MSNETPVAPRDTSTPAIPIALYESKGIVFELYRGGRSYQPPEPILWEHLKTFTVERDGGLTFNVRVSQSHFRNRD